MEDKTSKKIANALVFIATIMLLGVCKITSSVSINVVLSVFVFILLWPFAAGLERHKVPKSLVSLICIILIITIIMGFGWFLTFTVNSLLVSVPKYAGKIAQIDSSLTLLISRWIDIPADSSFLNWLNIDWVGNLMKILGTLSTSLISITKNLFMTILLTSFLIVERNTLIPKATMAAQEDRRDSVAVVINRICNQVSKYLIEKVIISFITGVGFYIVAKSVNLEFSFLWGVLAFVLNFIPTIGSIIITACTILMSVVQFLPNWTPIIVVAISTTLIQNILGNIIEPRIQGSALNLSPFVILVSLTIFDFIWGIVGMFLAVPLLSVLEIVFENMEGTKGIAMILSSGFSFKRKMRREHHRSRQPSLFENPSENFSEKQ